MIKRLLLAALIVVAGCLPASARFHHGGVANPAVNPPCPQVTDNGCSTSPGGNLLIANFFSGYTGTIYPARPTFNVPCVDYKCGVPTTGNPVYSFNLGGITVTGSCGMDTIQDPKTATKVGTSNDPGCGHMPFDCHYEEVIKSDQLTVSQIHCDATSANDIVIRGFEMGPTGGHNATYYFFENSETGRKVLAYNDFTAGTATYTQNSFGSFESGGQGNTIIFANNFFGKWVDSFSTVGTGNCSFSTSAMTCTGDTGFGLGQSVDATGITGAPVIVRINGSGSYTLNVNTATLTSRSTRGIYITGGGMGVNTTGSVIVEYNAFTQNNGRDISVQANTQVPGTAVTFTDSINKYNYYEGAIYANYTSLGQVHFETIEWELANAAHPVTYSNLDQSGNVCYAPSITSSLTACFWNHTGAISSIPTGVDFIVNYTNVTIDKNVAVVDLTNAQALTAIGADNRPGGGPVTNYTLTDNWIHKNASGTYTGCSGDPYLVGNTGQPVSFYHSSSNASTNKLVVDSFAGGTNIVFDGSNFVSESHQKILSQDSGTPGQVGTYSTSGGITLSGRNMRSAYPEILNASGPTVSGNIDLPTGSPIAGQFIINRADNTHPCVYQGMQ